MSKYVADENMKNYVFGMVVEHIGSGNAIKASEIPVDGRIVRSAVHQLRKDGIPICSEPQYGYYMPETANDIQRTIAFMEGRVAVSNQVITKLKESLNDY